MAANPFGVTKNADPDAAGDAKTMGGRLAKLKGAKSKTNARSDAIKRRLAMRARKNGK